MTTRAFRPFGGQHVKLGALSTYHCGLDPVRDRIEDAPNSKGADPVVV